MKWCWCIGRLLGIDVYMHTTFLIPLVWLGGSYYLPRQRTADIINGLTLIVALFGIVILHKMGHALSARRFGLRTCDITPLPIGGVARRERMPEDPRQELLVALAGPAVNVVLARFLLLVMVLTGAVLTVPDFRVAGGTFLSQLMWINVVRRRSTWSRLFRWVAVEF
jgi:Zn-dependent protease